MVCACIYIYIYIYIYVGVCVCVSWGRGGEEEEEGADLLSASKRVNASHRVSLLLLIASRICQGGWEEKKREKGAQRHTHIIGKGEKRQGTHLRNRVLKS